MSINLQTHFCVVPVISGDSLTCVISKFRLFCKNFDRLRFKQEDVESLRSLDGSLRYIFFFGQLTGSWRKHGVYCHRDRKKYNPVFISRQKFPIYTVPLGTKH